MKNCQQGYLKIDVVNLSYVLSVICLEILQNCIYIYMLVSFVTYFMKATTYFNLYKYVL